MMIIFQHFLDNKLDKTVYKPVYLNFSAGTTGNSIQRLINSLLDKRKKGTATACELSLQPWIAASAKIYIILYF